MGQGEGARAGSILRVGASRRETKIPLLSFTPFLFLPPPPIPKTTSPKHCPDRKPIAGFLPFPALEWVLLHYVSRNQANKQLPIVRRKPTPGHSSVPALTFYGPNPVHKEPSFLCLQ